MLHLRLVSPPDCTAAVIDVLDADPTAVNIIVLPGAGREPAGDVLLCDVARESASDLLAALRALDLEERGSIAVETVDTALSRVATEAVAAAPGLPADALVWEEVEARTSEEAELSGTFLALMAIATVIAAVGIVSDSQVLIVGAMVVGPEFGPLAGVAVGLVHRRWPSVRLSAVALAVGFPVAMVASWLATLAFRALSLIPDDFDLATRGETAFIAHPGWFSAIVALVAGVAGMLSLTSAKSGALIGVLVSVTTIPAAANIGVAAAMGEWGEFGGAAAQLGINLVCLVVAGVATLAVKERARVAPAHKAAAG